MRIKFFRNRFIHIIMVYIFIRFGNFNMAYNTKHIFSSILQWMSEIRTSQISSYFGRFWTSGNETKVICPKSELIRISDADCIILFNTLLSWGSRVVCVELHSRVYDDCMRSSQLSAYASLDEFVRAKFPFAQWVEWKSASYLIQ